MKMTTQKTFYHKDHGASLSTSVEKDSVVAPPFGAFFWPFIFSFFGLFYYQGQLSKNDDHHTSIYLQLMNYNSILEQSMTEGVLDQGVSGWPDYDLWPDYRTMKIQD